VKIDDELRAESDRLARAERVLGRTFSDRARLLSALTHRSFGNERPSAVPHNEVLEFLGDAVLSLVVVDELVRMSPEANEGELTVRRAAHVSTTNLARAATTHGLVGLLRTGRSLASGVTENVAADVVEAVLGAAYLDGGLDAARMLVAHLLGPPPLAAPATTGHAKQALQERLQPLVGHAPTYVVTPGEGPRHAPSFVAEVAFAGVVLGRGEGRNKRAATEAAAAAAVASLAEVEDATLLARFSSAGSTSGRR
jgi:ribonuclease-3